MSECFKFDRLELDGSLGDLSALLPIAIIIVTKKDIHLHYRNTLKFIFSWQFRYELLVFIFIKNPETLSPNCTCRTQRY